MGLLNAGQEMRTIKALLTEAEALALARGDELPGPEHLLVSALALPDGSAGRALGRFHADETALLAAIENVHATALADAGLEDVAQGPPVDLTAKSAPTGRAPRSFRSTPQAQQVFQEATALSKSARPSQLLGAHVVAAVCSLERGTAARALASLGIDRSQLRAAALDEAGVPR